MSHTNSLAATPAAPTVKYLGLDANYKPTYRVTTVEEKVHYLTGQIAMWERNAAEHEGSADRWAARGQHDAAARCLATAKQYRGEADRARAELAETLPAPMQMAAE